MRIRNLLVIAVLLISGLIIYSCDSMHLDPDVPHPDQFHALLNRDLEAFFRERHGPGVTVKHELLRERPTKVGVAYPKFYIWVKVENAAGLIDEGAVRAAAVQRKEFDILQFMSKRDIQANPSNVEDVFPKALADNIRERARLR